MAESVRQERAGEAELVGLLRRPLEDAEAAEEFGDLEVRGDVELHERAAGDDHLDQLALEEVDAVEQLQVERVAVGRVGPGARDVRGVAVARRAGVHEEGAVRRRDVGPLVLVVERGRLFVDRGDRLERHLAFEVAGAAQVGPVDPALVLAGLERLARGAVAAPGALGGDVHQRDLVLGLDGAVPVERVHQRGRLDELGRDAEGRGGLGARADVGDLVQRADGGADFGERGDLAQLDLALPVGRRGRGDLVPVVLRRDADDERHAAGAGEDAVVRPDQRHVPAVVGVGAEADQLVVAVVGPFGAGVEEDPVELEPLAGGALERIAEDLVESLEVAAVELFVGHARHCKRERAGRGGGDGRF